jgi:hypothetical protein
MPLARCFSAHASQSDRCGTFAVMRHLVLDLASGVSGNHNGAGVYLSGAALAWRQAWQARPVLLGEAAMDLASDIVIGTGALVIGIAMVWFGMPNKAGENPRLLRIGFMQMIYPAVVLMFVVTGVAELLKAFG